MTQWKSAQCQRQHDTMDDTSTATRRCIKIMTQRVNNKNYNNNNNNNKNRDNISNNSDIDENEFKL